MRLRPPARVAACCLLLLVGACRQEKAPDTAGPVAAPTAPTAPAAPAAPAREAASADAQFPTLTLATLDGAAYDLAAHRGKWVVVNFWATWCKPCVKEMPDLSALDTMREHVEVLGLAYDDSDPDAIRGFLAQHPVSYPIALVDMNDPPHDFATPRGLPTTYLIAPDGRMVKKFMGPITAKEIEAAIAQAGGPEPG
ncbi:TlpA family protein disulfide reductase [Agrilutibacter solisilvae]|uniref:TlpA family protein disulfide reductase n=1 Tax=Agrilutibacter solisilvae TaxID=2763317 RepID=A0A974Y1Q7_9GAMM|nr:TlpA disulfide reductase family protein [Lysobacter solisilvae]QSX79817.1 TlpA family protein disulfide reductase [Lysobacter solisilvae]